jgi:uncharacterized protein (DUF2252 family)
LIIVSFIAILNLKDIYMKKTFLLLFFSSFLLNIANAKLADVSYQFDSTKVAASDDSFHFLRSFVDYYYDLLAVNKPQLYISKASNYSGWCVGDAHPENFGVVLKNDSTPIFTMNDMDDFGPCPIAYDLLRLLVSSRLYLSSIDLNEIVSSYKLGLQGNSIAIPSSIQNMIQTAKVAGTSVSPKKVKGNSLKRKSESREVTLAEKQIITNNLETLYKGESLKVKDLIATTKVGGGSGGLSRYEVLCIANNQLLHVELKELTTPAIAAVATGGIPNQSERMKDALQVEQGNNFSHYYDVLNISGKEMLLRPRFAGNIGVDLTLNSEQDNTAIIEFEAYVLGRIHAESVDVKSYLASLNSLSGSQIESDVVALTDFFSKKYVSLKQ